MPWDPNNVTIKRLVNWVEFRADSLTPTGQTPAINHESIYAELQEAAKHVLLRAPMEVVLDAAKDGASSLNSAKATVNDRLTLPLPADFLRFIRIELDTWDIPVDDLLDPRSNQYRMQLNQFATAHIGAPLAAMVAYPSGPCKKALEVFPKSAAASPVTIFTYIGSLDPELMPTVLHDSMVWEGTFRVLMNTRDWEAAKAAQAASVQALAGLMIGKKGEEVPTK